MGEEGEEARADVFHAIQESAMMRLMKTNQQPSSIGSPIHPVYSPKPSSSATNEHRRSRTRLHTATRSATGRTIGGKDTTWSSTASRTRRRPPTAARAAWGVAGGGRHTPRTRQSSLLWQHQLTKVACLRLEALIAPLPSQFIIRIFPYVRCASEEPYA